MVRMETAWAAWAELRPMPHCFCLSGTWIDSSEILILVMLMQIQADTEKMLWQMQILDSDPEILGGLWQLEQRCQLTLKSCSRMPSTFPSSSLAHSQSCSRPPS